MIPLDIADPVVLRRTLEELEASIPKLSNSIGTINKLDDTADLTEVIHKVNEIAGTVNLLSSALNTSV